MAVPLFKKGVDLVKPHVKTAARNVAQDVVSHVTRRIMNKISPQEGSGFMYLKRRGGVKRKASSTRRGPPGLFKRSRRGTKKRRTAGKRGGTNKKRRKRTPRAGLKDVL